MVNIIGDIHGLDCWKQLVREDVRSYSAKLTA